MYNEEKWFQKSTCLHAFTCFVSFKQILLRRQDLTVLLRRLEDLQVQQILDAHLPSWLNRRVQRAAGTHLRPGEEKEEAVATQAADDPEHRLRNNLTVFMSPTL